MSGTGNGRDIDAVLDFWFGELSSAQWFDKDAALDAAIVARFGPLHARWHVAPPGEAAVDARAALASVIALDQFPRNMFRGKSEAFASDAHALAIARAAVAAGFDRGLSRNERLFLYLPFEHSEDAADQDRSVALISALGDATLTRYAIAHKDIVDRFGRFPHRNAALGRRSTPEEIAFLSTPGSSF